jgi:dGTPase
MDDGVSRLDWGKLLSSARLPSSATASSDPAGNPDWLVSSRTETERDFDRILFAAPTRRLGDKTQVFPLEKNESVRNRLTHSHEASNLARSIGTHIVHAQLGNTIVSEAKATLGEACSANVRRAIPAILAATGLAHDLGNPPFGHQGEEAIRDWIDRNDAEIFSVSERQKSKLGEEGRNKVNRDLERLGNAQREDFRKFEGNAQTMRTLMRLQVVKDDRGLNLTFGTLAALMKYTVPSDRVFVKTETTKGPAPTRKVGYFVSEASIIEKVRAETGLHGHARHPLTFIMEACDDIAYLIVDAEDAIKKQIVSFHDLMAWLRSNPKLQTDELSQWILAAAETGADAARKAQLPPLELNDVSMQIFRANAITAMVSAVIRVFYDKYEQIMTSGLDEPLMDIGRANLFARAMKDFDLEHAYKNKRVLEIELNGFNTIHGLMDMLWRGIVERERFEDLRSPRTSPFARFAYGRISENYRRVFEGLPPSAPHSSSDLPIRYRELQLLTDMIAGMTDQFAVDLHHELLDFHVGASAPRT